MKKALVLVVLAVGLIAVIPQPGAAAMPLWGDWSNNGEKDPAAAALLSLVPVPVALGQFYVGDWRTGLLYSLVETAEAATVIGAGAYEGTMMMRSGGTMRDWDSTGQAVFFSALGSFVLTKFVDAFTAGLAAEDYNRRNLNER